MRLEFHPAASAEFEAAIDTGLKFGARVGSALSEETWRVLDLLLAAPEIGIQLSPRLRRFSLERYPFMIIFRVQGDTLRVIAFAHKRRKPGYWKWRR